jgi:hypothetical protein
LIHAVSAYFDELTHLLCNGHIIANGYFTAKAAIKGVFPYPVEHHDPDEHPIVIDFRQGVTLRKATRTVQVKIIGKIPQHAIGEVTDCTTGSVNRLLTPGGMLIVKGRKLKIMGDDPTVGMYFINDLTGERYRLPANRLAENRPARLVLGIPELPAGDYSLMVITQYVGRSTPARQPAEATLSHFVVPAATLPLSSTLTRPSQASRPARVRLPDPPESGSHARKRKKQ